MTRDARARTQFAGYRIDDVVGRGGMGVVYRATELALERPVALKLIAPELAGDASFRALPARVEARGLDRPRGHPARVHSGRSRRRALPRQPVRRRHRPPCTARAGPLRPERALGLVGQVADALDAAHAGARPSRRQAGERARRRCGPLLPRPTSASPSSSQTATRASPGCWRDRSTTSLRSRSAGARSTGRTDQYALGCVLYELLSGAPPFRRETEARTLWAHMQEEPTPLAGYPELESVLARALAKEPGRALRELQRIRRRCACGARPRPSPVAVRRRRRRIGGRLLYAGAALVALAVVAVVLALTRGSSETAVAPPNSSGSSTPSPRSSLRRSPSATP